MIQTLSVREAQALLASGEEVDLVDVREPHEWRKGHLPGARLLPLDAVRADPSRLGRGKLLLVCARGSRSLAAAKLAEQHGRTEIFSLDGGTLAWIDAGLPIVSEPDEAPTTALETSSSAPPLIAEAGVPALDAVVGENLKRLRSERGLTLDALARETGLSRTLIGQIENGRTAPSVSMVWKIASAFGVPFATLLATPSQLETCVLRATSAKRLVSAEGRFSSRALFPLGAHNRVEFYELWLAPHSVEQAEPHQPGTQENLVVTAGQLELEIAGEQYTLGKGDAIVFKADVPHAYRNATGSECWMHLVMSYSH